MRKKHFYAKNITILAFLLLQITVILTSCEFFVKFYDNGKSAVTEHVHIEELVPGVRATCMDPGRTDATRCAVCGVYLKSAQVINPVEHTVRILRAIEGTCTREGLTEGSHCEECGLIFVEQELTGYVHEVVKDEAVLPTCTIPGKTDGSHCKLCGAVIEEQKEIPAAHKLPLSQEKLSKCVTVDSVYIANCTVCGIEVKQKYTSLPEHCAVAVPELAATCGTTGKTAGEECMHCGKALSGREKIDITTETHSFDGGKCTVCGIDGDSTVGLYYEVVEGKYAVLRSFSRVTAEKAVISSSFMGYPVKYIDCSGGSVNNEYIKELVIPEGISEIREHSFSVMPNLSKVSLPSTLEKIGEYAFFADSKLSDVILPDGLYDIGDFAFSRTGITSLTIPKSVTAMSQTAFSMCEKLSSVTVSEENPRFASLGNLVIEKGTKTLYMYVANGAELILPDDGSIRKIGEMAFSHNMLLKGLIIPECITEIGNNAFSESALEGIVLSPKTVKIGGGAFSRSALKAITLPGTVTDIGSNIFTECASLEIVILGEGLREIGHAMFWGCPISEIQLPSTLSIIGSRAFEATNLKGISIPFGVTHIGEYAFAGTKISHALIPDSVIYVGDGVFEQNSVLENVLVGASVSNLSSDWFSGNPALRAVNVSAMNPYFVTRGENVFEKETGTLILSLMKGDVSFDYGEITGFADRPFLFASKVTSIKLPQSLKTIGNSAFRGMNLKEIELPENIVFIGAFAFSECRALEKIVLPEGLIGISDYLFHSCDGLRSVSIPRGIRSIGENAFKDCKALRDIKYSGTKAEWKKIDIGKAAFSDSTEIKCGDGIVVIK